MARFRYGYDVTVLNSCIALLAFIKYRRLTNAKIKAIPIFNSDKKDGGSRLVFATLLNLVYIISCVFMFFFNGGIL